MLTALRFPMQFTKWVMACVTSVQFTIHINGLMSTPFKGGKGLRQGDPLSPLLFVLTMEYLSRLLRKARHEADFKFHPHCSKLVLTHLMFADELILFSKAHPASLHHIMSALHKFHECAGLMPNLAKSQMVLRECSPALHQKCIEITGL